MLCRISQLTLFGGLLGALAACGGDDGSAAPPAVDTRVLTGAQITAGVEVARGIVGSRNASSSPAQLAALGVIPRSATGTLDLYQVAPGGRTTLELDLDGDQVAESLSVFLMSNGPALLAWQDAGRCHLAYELNGTQWYIDAPCGADGGVVCSYAVEDACVFCDDERCSECTFDAADPARITCPEIEEPAPAEDISADAGTDTAVDVGSVEDAGEDAGAGADASVEDAAPEDVASSSGACESACMAQPDAVCCEGCGCGAQDCLPQCDAPFVWDCESQCCFDYSTLECQ